MCAPGLCAPGLCAPGLCASGLCVSRVCTSGLCASRVCASGLCASRVCASGCVLLGCVLLGCVLLGCVLLVMDSTVCGCPVQNHTTLEWGLMCQVHTLCFIILYIHTHVRTWCCMYSSVCACLQAKCRCVFGALMRNMTAVIRRDKTDCVLRVLLKPLLSVVSTMRLSEVLSNVTALAKGPPQANPPRSALVMAGSCSFGANLLIGLIGRGNSASLEDDTPTDERKEW